VNREPSVEEVAAAIAVAAVLQSATAVPAEPSAAAPSMWVEASRRSARRVPLSRGSWRLSGRIGRRPRT